jgi:hypothetical protein
MSTTKYIVNNSPDQTINGEPILKPYKVYTALVTQSGTASPTASVLENTIGDIVWTRTSAGVYLAVTNALYTDNKTIILQENGNINNTFEVRTRILDDSNIEVNLMSAGTGTGYDGEIINMSIEIRVYN